MEEETKSPEIKQKPNMSKAWAVLVAVFITGIAVAWGQNKILPVMTFIMADLNVSAQIAGWINSAYGIVGIILAFPAAGMIRKMGVKASGLAALIISIIGAIIGFVAPNEVADGVKLMGVTPIPTRGSFPCRFPPRSARQPTCRRSWRDEAAGNRYRRILPASQCFRYSRLPESCARAVSLAWA